MSASLYMCQHPTSVLMYPCPLCQPFGILGCFFPGLEAGASHWSYFCSRAAFPTDSLLDIHCFFPSFNLFFLPFSNPPLLPAGVRGWGCAATWRHDPGKPGKRILLLGKSVFLLFFCFWSCVTFRKPSSTNKYPPPKKKATKEGKHSNIFGIS